MARTMRILLILSVALVGVAWSVHHFGHHSKALTAATSLAPTGTIPRVSAEPATQESPQVTTEPTPTSAPENPDNVLKPAAMTDAEFVMLFEAAYNAQDYRLPTPAIAAKLKPFVSPDLLKSFIERQDVIKKSPIGDMMKAQKVVVRGGVQKPSDVKELDDASGSVRRCSVTFFLSTEHDEVKGPVILTTHIVSLSTTSHGTRVIDVSDPTEGDT